MKIRQVDDLIPIVISKKSAEPFFRIWKGDPSCTTFPSFDLFLRDILNFEERVLGNVQ